LRNGFVVPILVAKALSMLPPKLRRLDDHVIARQRRMYARLLFVVVSVFAPVSPDLAALVACSAIPGGLAWGDAADIRFAHE
jgi:hypothetical protein